MYNGYCKSVVSHILLICSWREIYHSTFSNHCNSCASLKPGVFYPNCRGCKKSRIWLVGFFNPLGFCAYLGMWHPREDQLWGPHARRHLQTACSEHTEGAAPACREEPDGLQCSHPGLQGRAAGPKGGAQPGQDWRAVSNSSNSEGARWRRHLLTRIFGSLCRNVDLNPSLFLKDKLLLP